MRNDGTVEDDKDLTGNAVLSNFKLTNIVKDSCKRLSLTTTAQ